MMRSQPKSSPMPSLLRTLRGPWLLQVLPLNAGAAITLQRAEAATVFGLSPITAGVTIEHFPNNVTHQAPQEATRAATVVIPLGLALQTALRALLIGQVTICVLTLSSNTCYMKKRVLFMSARIRTSGQKHQLGRINRG